VDDLHINIVYLHVIENDNFMHICK